MAVDAITRLYDVDEDTVEFTRLDRTKSYDQGVFTFRARKGKLIDLVKLHESIWATRLSGGTRSGLVSLEVAAIGKVIRTKAGVMLKVFGSDGEFTLSPNAAKEQAAVYEQLVKSMVGTEQLVKVTGVIDDYKGRWPNLLRKKPDRVRRLLVTGFDVID